MSFLKKALAITWKDALAEMRTKEIISAVLVFTLLVIVIFNFAFGKRQDIVKEVASGMLWVTFAFAGVLSLNRAFIMEKEDGCLEGLMVSPVSRDAVYVGKMISSLLFMLMIEAISLPIFSALFGVPVLSVQMIVIVLLTTFGFVAVGTLFSALAVNTKAREMVLPILFFPIIAPVIICAVNASDLAITGATWGELGKWLQVIIAFDAIFVVVSYLIFAYVIEE